MTSLWQSWMMYLLLDAALIQFTPVKAPRHNSKYSVIGFCRARRHAVRIRYPRENKAELTYPKSPRRFRLFCYVKILTSLLKLPSREMDAAHWHLRAYGRSFFSLATFTGRAVKSNKTPFLYLVFRQCSRDDNRTCSPVYTTGYRRSFTKNWHAHMHVPCRYTSSVVAHTQCGHRGPFIRNSLLQRSQNSG